MHASLNTIAVVASMFVMSARAATSPEPMKKIANPPKPPAPMVPKGSGTPSKAPTVKDTPRAVETAGNDIGGFNVNSPLLKRNTQMDPEKKEENDDSDWNHKETPAIASSAAPKPTATMDKQNTTTAKNLDVKSDPNTYSREGCAQFLTQIDRIRSGVTGNANDDDESWSGSDDEPIVTSTVNGSDSSVGPNETITTPMLNEFVENLVVNPTAQTNVQPIEQEAQKEEVKTPEVKVEVKPEVVVPEQPEQKPEVVADEQPEQKPAVVEDKQPMGWGAWFKSFFVTPEEVKEDNKAPEEGFFSQSEEEMLVPEGKNVKQKSDVVVSRRVSPIPIAPKTIAKPTADQKPEEPALVGVPKVTKPGAFLPPVDTTERIPEPNLTAVPKVSQPMTIVPPFQVPAPDIEVPQVQKPVPSESGDDSDDDIPVITPLSMKPEEANVVPAEKLRPIALADVTSGASFTAPSVLAGILSAVLFLAL